MKIKDCMCHDVAYLEPNTTVEECAKLMESKHVGCIPVCDYNKNIVGLITDRDLILRCVACGKDARHTTISDIMTSNVCCCNQNDEVEQAKDTMCSEQIRRLPVVDENNKVVGIITLGDLCNNNNINTQYVGQTLENICNCKDKNAE